MIQFKNTNGKCIFGVTLLIILLQSESMVLDTQFAFSMHIMSEIICTYI